MVKKTDADEPPARKRTPTQKAKAAPKKKGKGKKKIDVSSDDSEIEDGGPPVPFKHIDIEKGYICTESLSKQLENRAQNRGGQSLPRFLPDSPDRIGQESTSESFQNRRVLTALTSPIDVEIYPGPNLNPGAAEVVQNLSHFRVGLQFPYPNLATRPPRWIHLPGKGGKWMGVNVDGVRAGPPSHTPRTFGALLRLDIGAPVVVSVILTGSWTQNEEPSQTYPTGLQKWLAPLSGV
ncbi:hypothetical protein DFH09DRAFT_1478709 [Mycena vulgaris]|nr:hypothetical protein DFH09DRAFT_1478709 [Mycena vulgaris]